MPRLPRSIGMQAVYLDAGSGANRPVSTRDYSRVPRCRCRATRCSSEAGSGRRRRCARRDRPGADFVVIGTVVEEGPQGELGTRGGLGGLGRSSRLHGERRRESAQSLDRPCSPRRAGWRAEQAEEIAAIADRYEATLRGGGTLFFAGNGGSAADAQHLATEYVVRYQTNRPAMRAIALTTDTSLLTACANDLGFDEVFSRQVEALADAGRSAGAAFDVAARVPT